VDKRVLKSQNKANVTIPMTMMRTAIATVRMADRVAAVAATHIAARRHAVPGGERHPPAHASEEAAGDGPGSQARHRQDP